MRLISVFKQTNWPLRWSFDYKWPSLCGVYLNSY